MSVGTPTLTLQELGLPVIEPNKILVGGGRTPTKNTDIPRLIAQSIITTLIFLIIIVWFTLALDASVRELNDTDYYLFQFSVYFSIIAIFVIIFILLLIF